MSNFIKNPSSGGGVFPCGRTDRHDEVNSRISQFWERAYNGYQSVATEVKICSVIAFRQIVTYWLTLRNRVLLEKLTGFQLVNKFPHFMKPDFSLPPLQKILPVPIGSQINPVQVPHPTSWSSILILSSHLRLGLSNGLFPSDFPTKTLYTPLLSPIRATCLAHIIFHDLVNM